MYYAVFSESYAYNRSFLYEKYIMCKTNFKMVKGGNAFLLLVSGSIIFFLPEKTLKKKLISNVMQIY